MQKILVVEDEASIRKGLKDNLKAEGYAVLTGESPRRRRGSRSSGYHASGNKRFRRV